MLRLSRQGKKKQPTYRLIVSEKTKDTLGAFLEELGNYNPRTKTINLKVERIQYWLAKGAQCSPTVHNLLVDQKVIGAKKVKASGGKKKKAEGETTAAPAVTAAIKTEPEVKASETKTEETK